MRGAWREEREHNNGMGLYGADKEEKLNEE
jgi:hypothetical protein